MRETTIILHDRSMLITVMRETTDPANWILRQWKVSWWRNRRILSLWFIDRGQAIQVAESLKRQHEAGRLRPA